MTEWISCISCNYRFKDFIRTCPNCNKNVKSLSIGKRKNELKGATNLDSILKSNKKTPLVLSIVAFAIITTAFALNAVSESNHVSIVKLKEYALKKINEDRSKYGLSPVKLSENQAAQSHAQELVKTEKLSHWTTDGMKPYMRYSHYGGKDSVSQNVAQVSSFYTSVMLDPVSGKEYESRDVFDDAKTFLCKNGLSICLNSIDPYKSIDHLEYGMMYDDMEHGNGHRLNILDKHHTHVSLGIAYNKYYFALVQNFENKHTIWNKPASYDNSSKIVSLNGIAKDNASFAGITISYDPLPTIQTYKDNFDKESYGEGKEIAEVVQPSPSIKQYYANPNKRINIIEANKWAINDNLNSSNNTSYLTDYYNNFGGYHSQFNRFDLSNMGENNTLPGNFDISFSINDLTNKHGKGVYTINTWYKDIENEPFKSASVSLFIG
jgi:uncharacterized protein YkwD